MLDLFVLHANVDDEVAFVRGALLPALGLPPDRVLLSSALPPGMPLIQAIENGVTRSRATLLILSPKFLQDTWARFGEVLAGTLAVTGGIQIPLILVDCKLPLRLQSLVTLDCRDPGRRTAELQRLRDFLAKERESASDPPGPSEASDAPPTPGPPTPVPTTAEVPAPPEPVPVPTPSPSEPAPRPPAPPPVRQDPEDPRPPRRIAKYVAGVVAVMTGAATIYGLFRSPQVAIASFIGMIFAIVLLVVVNHAAGAINRAQSDILLASREEKLRRARFWEYVVQGLVVFVLLYFVAVAVMLLPRLLALFKPEPTPAPAIDAAAAAPSPDAAERAVDGPREYKVIKSAATFTAEPFEHEVYVVPAGRQFVLEGYSVAGDVDVELLSKVAGSSTSILRLGTSEGAGFNEGKGPVAPAGAQWVLHSLTGAGTYEYKFSGYLRPAPTASPR